MGGAEPGAAARRPAVILGVTGSIAAYKAAFVASRLHQAGVEVHVVMTEAATRLVQPATFYPLTGNPVHWDLWAPETVQAGARVEHVGLADRADLLCIAPATANTIGKLANGLADNFLSTFALAFGGPVMVAPAMNDVMMRHPAVQRNLRQLEADGVELICAGEGPLACGRDGPGRLAEPEEIVQRIRARLAALRPGGETADGSVPVDLATGAARPLRVLVTAGPTRERIDPVRVLTNRSSGRMGDAVAARLHARGHTVTLVRGPVERPAPGGVRVVPVETTEEMAAACFEAFPGVDAVVMAAAPCDFRPAQPSPHKTKKAANPDGLFVALSPTVDILAAMGARKSATQRLVGFALETEGAEAEARRKLRAKRLDLIVQNGPQSLASDEAEAVLLGADGSREPFRGPKTALADRLVERLEALCGEPDERCSPSAVSSRGESGVIASEDPSP